MAVEESYSPGKYETYKKFYYVRSIEIESPSSVGIGFNHTPIMENDDSNIEIADLYDFVKTYDKDFKPGKAVDKSVLNEDGTPKVFYHGTDADFSVFDPTKSRSNMDIQGSFFSPWELDAAGYGKNTI